MDLLSLMSNFGQQRLEGIQDSKQRTLHKQCVCDEVSCPYLLTWSMSQQLMVNSLREFPRENFFGKTSFYHSTIHLTVSLIPVGRLRSSFLFLILNPTLP